IIISITTIIINYDKIFPKKEIVFSDYINVIKMENGEINVQLDAINNSENIVKMAGLLDCAVYQIMEDGERSGAVMNELRDYLAENEIISMMDIEIPDGIVGVSQSETAAGNQLISPGEKVQISYVGSIGLVESDNIQEWLIGCETQYEVDGQSERLALFPRFNE
ncbi:MAG: hypothetical protein AAF412_10020, partial [Pseudomonadota bacterium]